MEALADRDFDRAAGAFETAWSATRDAKARRMLYALCLAGRVEEAERIVQDSGSRILQPQDRGYWDWMSETLGLSNPR